MLQASEFQLFGMDITDITQGAHHLVDPAVPAQHLRLEVHPGVGALTRIAGPDLHLPGHAGQQLPNGLHIIRVHNPGRVQRLHVLGKRVRVHAVPAVFPADQLIAVRPVLKHHLRVLAHHQLIFPLALLHPGLILFPVRDIHDRHQKYRRSVRRNLARAV